MWGGGSRFVFAFFFLFWSLSGQDIGKTTVGNWGWSRQAHDEEEWEGEEDEKKAQKGLLVVLNKLDLHEARRYTFAFIFLLRLHLSLLRLHFSFH